MHDIQAVNSERQRFRFYKVDVILMRIVTVYALLRTDDGIVNSHRYDGRY